ncbi:MAG: family 10 glycosylhydrolase [Bacteroidaceae bacterium]|nr:family 10 glycosylhydrolase [Bacteroidaceae bacterium]
MMAQNVADASMPYNQQHPKREVRAVWLTTINGLDWPRTKANDVAGMEKQKAELVEILDRLQRIHINTVILQTRVRGTVIYPSQYEPWDECLTGHPGRNPGYDPLQFCIEECHRRGMELHAWLVCIPLGKAAKQKQYGAESIVRRQPALCKTVGQEVFMIPGQEGTADYIATLCREIADKYDIDGISLDYIRYPESVYKFSDDGLFRRETDSNPVTAVTPKVTTSRKKAKRSAVPKATATELANWRRENITRIVRRVHDTVKPLKPWVKLSSSPIGKYSNLSRYSSGGWNCYNAVYQDPQFWLKENLQDMLFPMMYFQGNHFYPFLFDWLEHSYGHPVVPGLGIYFLDPREGKWTLNTVRAEMHTTRWSGIGGMAFYRSDFLTRNVKGLYDCCQDEFFPYPALTPKMDWMGTDNIQPKSPTGLHHTEERLQWQGDAPYYNVYGSNLWPVDIEKAEHLLAVRVTGNSYLLNGRALRMRYYAVTACDRFGNESMAVQDVQDGHATVKELNVSRLINPDLKGQKKSASKKSSKKKK